MFSGKIPNLQYDLGGRIEYFDRLVEIAQPLSDFKLKRLNFYPSANLLYNVSETISLKAGYNRRIERTTTFKMTPFPEREHNETLEQGDAELLPEYIDALEMGIIKKWGDHNFFITAYGKKVQNVINRVNNIFNDTILNRIYTNAGRAQSYGVEFGASLYPASWFQFYLASNIYGYQIEGNLFNEIIKTKNLVHSFTINSDFKVHKNLTVQAGLNYVSERITAQGEDSRFYNPSLSIRKKFSNKPFSLTLQWLNIDMGLLNSNEQRITTYRNNFFTTTNYIYEVDIIKLNVSYLINQKTTKSKQLKSEFGDREF